MTDRNNGTHTRGVVDLLVILPGLKVGQRCEQPCGIGHHFETAIDKIFLEQLLERPPDALHKAEIERLVIVIKVDPATHALDGRAPLGRVAHDDRTALSVVLVDTHFEYIFARLDAKLLINLVLYGYAVGVPAETAWYVETRDMGVACDDILPLDQEFPVSGWRLNKEIEYLDGTSE